MTNLNCFTFMCCYINVIGTIALCNHSHACSRSCMHVHAHTTFMRLTKSVLNNSKLSCTSSASMMVLLVILVQCKKGASEKVCVRRVGLLMQL